MGSTCSRSAKRRVRRGFSDIGSDELVKNRMPIGWTFETDPQVISRKLLARAQSDREMSGRYGLPGSIQRVTATTRRRRSLTFWRLSGSSFMTHDWFSHSEEGTTLRIG